MQQIQLVKKVGLRSNVRFNHVTAMKASCFHYSTNDVYGHQAEYDYCVSILHKAGSQLEALTEEQPDEALLESCLHTLSLVYTSLQAKNPLRRAIARYRAKFDYS